MVRRALHFTYRQARRVVVTVLGVSVIAIGVAMIVLPGPAFLVIPAGLGILGLEWAWARRWLRTVRSHAENLIRRNGGAVTDRGNGRDVADPDGTTAGEAEGCGFEAPQVARPRKRPWPGATP